MNFKPGDVVYMVSNSGPRAYFHKDVSYVCIPCPKGDPRTDSIAFTFAVPLNASFNEEIMRDLGRLYVCVSYGLELLDQSLFAAMIQANS